MAPASCLSIVSETQQHRVFLVQRPERALVNLGCLPPRRWHFSSPHQHIQKECSWPPPSSRTASRQDVLEMEEPLVCLCLFLPKKACLWLRTWAFSFSPLCSLLSLFLVPISKLLPVFLLSTHGGCLECPRSEIPVTERKLTEIKLSLSWISWKTSLCVFSSNWV